MVVSGMVQFYFMGTARFMQDTGIKGRYVPAAMAIAQAFQAAATYFLLSLVLRSLGFKWTLTIGVACWTVLFAVYIAGRPRTLIVASQSLHGFAYMFFVIGGQIFANSIAGPEIRGSMQALVFAATVGVGLFFGTQIAGITLDRFSREGKFHWRGIWMVPAALMLASTLALATIFQEPPAAEENIPEHPGAEIIEMASAW